MSEKRKETRAKKRDRKQEKPGVGSRFVSFLKSIRSELKKVMWSDSKRLKKNTATVLAIVLMATVMIFIFDWFVGQVLGFAGFYRVKENVQTPLPTQLVGQDNPGE